MSSRRSSEQQAASGEGSGPAPHRGRKRKSSDDDGQASSAPKRSRDTASEGIAAEMKEVDEEALSDPTVKQEPVKTERSLRQDTFDEAHVAVAPATSAAESVRCPYLDTVCRSLLDFDMAKVCSVTLSDQNVYACLVCGRFFQGRGKTTPLYTHSVQMGHFVVMSLHTGRAYCLPEGYEIGKGTSAALVADARSLADVQRCLHPSFSAEDIHRLSRHNTTLARDVHGVSYLPGFVGLNNLKHTDYVSVAIHAISHVAPIRDFFLVPSNYESSRDPLVHRFGEVMRKMWSSHNFKSVVSPQEFLQQVSVSSKKRFTIGRQEECIEFIVWLLNELHRGIGGTNRPGSSVIHRSLQGLVQVHSLTRRKNRAIASDATGAMDIVEEQQPQGALSTQWDESTNVSPFLYLGLDIPPSPLFKDSQGGLVIPQIPLFEVLKKFDGSSWTDIPSAAGLVRRKYAIKKLPKYLMVHLVRFTKNNFYVEKNPSIVTFPVTNLDMKQYVCTETDSAHPEPVLREAVDTMNVSDLRALVGKNIQAALAVSGGSDAVRSAGQELGKRLQQCIDREELVSVAMDSADLLDSSQAMSTKYDLLCNICHDSLASQGTDIGSDQKSISGGPTSSENVLTQGSYRCHVQNKATGQWFEVQDLHVSETMPQLIALSESYILIYERKGAAGV